jgi:hypothetical protein
VRMHTPMTKPARQADPTVADWQVARTSSGVAAKTREALERAGTRARVPGGALTTYRRGLQRAAQADDRAKYGRPE